LPDDFTLVISGQIMQNMKGEDLTNEPIGTRPDIPIILCTGFSEIISQGRAKAVGIREYVMKPVLKGEMANAIRRVIDQEKVG
jgi:DNA-binding NtrC family response regulator